MTLDSLASVTDRFRMTTNFRPSNVIPQKPPPPPRREAGEPLHPSDPIEVPDRPTTPADPPASQPPPAPRVQAAPRSRRGTGRLELPGQPPKPEIIGRRAAHSDPLMLLSFDPFRSASARSR
jgi:hypothetical protein